MIGLQYLVLADAASERPSVNAATAMLVLIQQLSEELSAPGQPLFKLFSELLHHRMGVPVDVDVHAFDPAHWLTTLAATGVDFDV